MCVYVSMYVCVCMLCYVCAVMAATIFIAVTYFMLFNVFNVLYCRSNHLVARESYYLTTIEREWILSYPNVLEYPNSTLHLKWLTRRTTTQRRIRFTICKWSKHGYTCLSTPERSHVADLTICMDVHPNPGWDLLRSVSRQSNFPAIRELHANEATVNRSFCFRDQLRYHGNTAPTSCYFWLRPSNAVLCETRKYRRSRGGKQVKKKQEMQRNTRIGTLVTRQRPQRQSRGYRNQSNLIVVNVCSKKSYNGLSTSERKDANIPTTTSPSATKNNTVFCLLNSQSLNNKSADFIDYVCDIKADIIAVTETWFTENDSAAKILCTPQGYKLFDCPRQNRTGGGTAIICRKNINISRIDSPQMSSFEFSAWKLKISSSYIRLIIVYRPGSSIHESSIGEFLTDFEKLLADVILCKEQLLITGDFNIHVDDPDNNYASKFLDLLSSFGLEQHVTEPTHIHGHTLDLVITRNSDPIVKAVPPKADRLFSDHFTVIGKLSVTKPCTIKTISTSRKLKAIDQLQLKLDLANTALCLNPPDDLEELVKCYNDTLKCLLDKHAPLITKVRTVRTSCPWFNKNIHQLKRLRRKAEKKWRLTKLHEDFISFKSKKNQTTKAMNQAKTEYYRNLIRDNIGDQKKLFKAVKSLFKQESELSFHEYPDNTVLANKIGDYFVQKIELIRKELDEEQIPPSQNQDWTHTLNCQLDSFRTLSQNDLHDIIRKSSRKSCILDPLPTPLVIECLDILAPTITKIVNTSLTTGKVPLSWKEAVVHPTQKKPNINEFKNLRPVNNLTFVSKLTERAVFNQLHNHLSENDLYPKVQSAYRQHHSTETALLKVHNDILLNMNKQHITLLVLLDLSAAFDTVDHSLLLNQLCSFGVQSTAMSWFASYLSNRTQRVVISGSSSQPSTMKFGVPQGSCLGPLLFVIYSSELYQIIISHLPGVTIFADDSQLWISFKPDSEQNQDAAYEALQYCIIDIKKWMIKKKLKMNDDKTEFLLIGTRQQLKKVEHHPIKIGDELICPVNSARNLGSWFDSNMSFKTHINKTCSAGFYHLRNISRIKKFVSPDLLESLIHSFITSKLDYCNSLLYGVPDFDLIKLQRIQNAAARLVTNSDRFCHITPVLRDLHWLPIKLRIQYKILLITFKALHNLAPTYVQELVTLKPSTKYSLRSDNSLLLYVPAARTYKTLGDRAFSYSSPYLWNRLPNYIRNLKSLQLFKSHLKTYLFKSHFYS